MASQRKNIGWTDDMVETLLSLVLYHKLHLKAGKTGVREAWSDLNDSLFEQDSFAEVRHLKGVPRKIEEKYGATMTAMKNFMQTGNKSKYDGDLPKSFVIAEKIIMEEEEHKAGVESQKDLKRKLDDTADYLLEEGVQPRVDRKKPNQGWGARKGLDGSIQQPNSSSSSGSSGSSKSRLGTPQFEDKLFSFLSLYLFGSSKIRPYMAQCLISAIPKYNILNQFT